MIQVRWKLKELKGRLLMEKGADLSWKAIADGAGLHINTIYSLRSEPVQQRLETSTAEKLLEFFRNKGLSITHEDLFDIEEDEHVAA